MIPKWNIGLFLEKFKTLGVSQGLFKSEALRLIEEIVGVKLEARNISYQNGTLFVKSQNVVKNEIFFKKAKLIEELDKLFPQKVKDIK